MFCLRSWLPLLFIPTNASPAFIVLFFLCTYFLNRPCVYCSVLLLILFVTSCYWSDRCFFDFSGNWFAPRPSTSYYSSNTSMTEPAVDSFNATAVEMLNTTANALAGAAADELARRKAEWTGLGIEWLRSLLGRREWRIECMDLNIRL
ncbi:bladder cancer-related protein BC10-domain-containing protein [Pseudomassariella vexata]|uniref:Bladder cancer-related protein BC10-domain-containing protein n=1 Tax=Pseudomassariella vexata TaxID=1141098 RepID=A0A1Y2DYM1_9PEZI|nr:bladder cancer-related protein BC10-domain-containing protein [Pseudomassariella vexata]ORY64184.1 bladder cancer-related protein BC10-domain-containing protein [Pseudomassariella vexata]